MANNITPMYEEEGLMNIPHNLIEAVPVEPLYPFSWKPHGNDVWFYV